MKTDEEVHNVARTLRMVATHFDYSDWEYTRDTGKLKRIVYEGDNKGYHVWWRRYWRAFTRTTGLYRKKNWEKQLLSGIPFNWSPRARWHTFKVWSRLDRHMPDGVLDRGGVIVFWEETADFINLMSPAVGEILADWLDAEPENEHAQKIAELMSKPPSYVEQAE